MLRRKPLQAIHFPRLEPQYQIAAKTMERPQLFLSLASTEPYQQRERRAYACYVKWQPPNRYSAWLIIGPEEVDRFLLKV
jgi:hypothetical protein